MSSTSPMYLEVEDIFAIGAAQQSRRKSSVSKEQLNYTNRAILTFVEAVAKMNEGVLVPSKLRDIEVRESDASSLMPVNSDLYSFFQMLNTVRQDLFSNSKFQNAFGSTGGGGGGGALSAGSAVPSATNSGQNSGRVTPTGNLSRRSSMIGMYGGSGSVPTTAMSPTGGAQNGRHLAPPNSLSLERRLSCYASTDNMLSPDFAASSPSPSSPLPSNGNAGNVAGNGISSTAAAAAASVLLSPSSPSNSSPQSLLSPLLSFDIAERRSQSLSSLLAAAGFDSPDSDYGTTGNGGNGSSSSSSEERVQQITSCFLHHLNALYTILGHFTRAANYILRRYQDETD